MDVLTLLLLLFSAFSCPSASLGHGRPKSHIVKHGMFPSRLGKFAAGHRYRAPLARRQNPSQGSCGSSKLLTVNAPKPNIFLGLTDNEAAAVTTFLHAQNSLNLTAAAIATR